MDGRREEIRMRGLLAAVLVCAVASVAAAQPSHQWRGKGHHGGHSGPSKHWEVPSPWGAFWGGLLGGYLATQQDRLDDDEEVVEGDLEPWSEEWFASCKRRYKSFDPGTGTYLSYSGERRFCK